MMRYCNLPFVIMAGYALWQDRAEQGFRPVPWDESLVRRDILAVWTGIQDRVLQIWKSIRLPDTPIIGPTRALIRHPKFWMSVLAILWSMFWTLFCVVTTVALLNTLGLYSHLSGRDNELGFVLAGTLGAYCWLLGEIVLLRHLKYWYRCWVNHQHLPASAGPRTALLASLSVSLPLGLLLLALPWYIGVFQFDDKLLPLHGSLVTESGILSCLFAIPCAISALFLGWRRLRWITRAMLLIAGIFPIAFIVVLSNQGQQVPPLSLLMLLHVLLAVPALVWGLWGTRQSTINPARQPEPTPSMPPPAPSAALQ